ncbi:unnamed protein product [Miscanthus lutarioriparius]|uniref:Uncharacterized protein n=1 Tax=Miscanthus lutarioriparius TaxID=422564 RepID=A0A811SKP1_9POAL|nr:unnamed protein product [Miscanthus lutarioriparius]
MEALGFAARSWLGSAVAACRAGSAAEAPPSDSTSSPYGFSKRATNRGDGPGAGAAPRVAAADARTGGGGAATCSFRAHPAPPVTQAVSWGAKPEPGGNGAGAVWERRAGPLSGPMREDAGEEYGAPVVRAKRTRMGGDGDEVWFHRSIAGTVQAAGSGDGEEAEEEKVFLVPSAAAFPQGTSAAAGPSLAAAKKEEFSKSPSNSPASSGGTDGGSSAVRPEQLHAHNGAPAARVEAMELVVALTACADSLAACNHDAANYYLARLGEMASPAGPTPMHRMAAYFAEALALRVVRMWPHVFDVAPPRELTDGAVAEDDDATALLVLNAVTPIPRFLHFTLNERPRHARGSPAHVRITSVGESRQELQETGAWLGCVAAALGLAFEFHAVVDHLEDVRLCMLHVKRGECIAMNCVLGAHRLLRNETGATIADFLGLARSTGAAILLLGEHEDALNSGCWEARFARAAVLRRGVRRRGRGGAGGHEPARAKAEEMFARRSATQWRSRPGTASSGTRPSPGGGGGAGRLVPERRHRRQGGNAGAHDREGMFAPGNYSVQAQDDGEGLTLRWMDQAMYTVSAWTPVSDAGGGGSTVSASVSTHSIPFSAKLNGGRHTRLSEEEKEQGFSVVLLLLVIIR